MPWTDGRWTGDTPTVEALFEGGDPPECRCCTSVGVPLEVFSMCSGSRDYEFARSRDEPPFRALCAICANTLLGAYSEYPQQHDFDALETMKVIAFVGNLVLAALDKKADRP